MGMAPRSTAACAEYLAYDGGSLEIIVLQPLIIFVKKRESDRNILVTQSQQSLHRMTYRLHIHILPPLASLSLQA